VTAGTQYALVAYTAHVANDYAGWRYESADPYSQGAAFFSHDPLPPQGGWMENGSGNDFAFKTYVVPAPPAAPAAPSSSNVTGQRAAALKKCKKKAKKKDWTKTKLRKCKKKARKLPI
jgi:hypothetical protein